jgi:hypothetical protein
MIWIKPFVALEGCKHEWQGILYLLLGKKNVIARKGHRVVKIQAFLAAPPCTLIKHPTFQRSAARPTS